MSKPESIPFLPTPYALEWVFSGEPAVHIDKTKGPQRLELVQPELDLIEDDDGGHVLNNIYAHRSFEALVAYEQTKGHTVALTDEDRDVQLIGPRHYQEVMSSSYHLDEVALGIFKAHYEERWREAHPQAHRDFEPEPVAERYLRLV